jgi:hypothetical protein
MWVSPLVNTDELFQLDGIIAVAQLDDLGRIVDWKARGVVDPETKEHMSKLIVENKKVNFAEILKAFGILGFSK